MFLELCDMMLGINCVDVDKCQSEDSFVCFGAKPTQRACVQDLPQDWKRTREGRSQGEQIRKQKRPGQRTGQLTEQGSRQKRLVHRIWGKQTVERGDC